jgi:hypothetical protein
MFEHGGYNQNNEELYCEKIDFHMQSERRLKWGKQNIRGRAAWVKKRAANLEPLRENGN